MKIRSLLLSTSVFLFVSALLSAADWPQWRGPQRDGHSKETGLLQEWPKEGPKLLWQVKDIGYGYSTPSVVGDQIYLLSNKGMDDEYVQALRVADGKQVWATRLGKVGRNRNEPHPAARSTPTVDGDMLYALGSDGDLACVKKADGAIVWSKNLPKDFGGKPGIWAYAESPLIDGNVLVCSPGGKQSTMIALDKTTGKTIWQAAIPGADEAAYASANVYEIGGVKQYVQYLQKGVVSVDAKTGKFLWRYESLSGQANIPTPVVRDSSIYISTGASGGALFNVTVDKGEFAAKRVYGRSSLPSRIGGSVLVGDNLFGTKVRGLYCIEFATGVEKWQNKEVGPGSVCVADGRIYYHGENGEVALIEPTSEAYHEKGRFTPPDQPERGISRAWAYPVVANGKLYLRDLGVLWCYDVKASGK